MALFFFVVGLEVKRELVTGQLSDRRDAALPLVAALGGMLVPAAIFLVVNAGGDGARGWGIAMATDIAFALGVLSLLGERVPGSLKVLLLGLAIADDIGAILVIAVFYADDVDARWLAAAIAGLVAVVAMRRADRWSGPAFAVIGVAVWVCTHESGVHATIAGVALGLLTPLATAERLETAWHPWTSYVVLPVFALANAGIDLGSSALRDAASSPVAIGIVLGLVVGKLVGITGAAWLVVRSGLARLPDDLTWRHVAGMGALGGIGFTVSIFVTGLAYSSPSAQEHAKVGVLTASVLAALVGVVLLRGPEKSSGELV
jgi:NhaA family Na+:H+ antiporter